MPCVALFPDYYSSHVELEGNRLGDVVGCHPVHLEAAGPMVEPSSRDDRRPSEALDGWRMHSVFK